MPITTCFLLEMMDRGIWVRRSSIFMHMQYPYGLFTFFDLLRSLSALFFYDFILRIPLQGVITTVIKTD